MASLKKKKQLIDRIKHGVRKYKFSIQRYGGETVIGTITPYQYHYWKGRESELTEYVMGIDRQEYEKEHNIPEEAKMRDWFEIDNVAHTCGAPIESANYLHVEEYDQDGNAIRDDNGNYTFRDPIQLDFINREKLGIQTEDGECIDVDHPSLVNQYYLWGNTSNKGGWTTDEDIEIEGELDFKKLKLHYKQIEGSDICYAISYGDGEPRYLQEDSSGHSQECRVLEGYMNDKTMSKKFKEEVARAEAEASQPDTEQETELSDIIAPEHVEDMRKSMDKKAKNSNKKIKKNIKKVKKTTKGKKQIKKKKK